MAIHPAYIKLSRQLRRQQTPWEKKLWMHLKDRRFLGLKFRRQVVLGPYIYDFGCFEKRLIIELDGSQHMKTEIIKKDLEKQRYAEQQGYRVIRFYNNDIERNFAEVLDSLRNVLQ